MPAAPAAPPPAAHTASTPGPTPEFKPAADPKPPSAEEAHHFDDAFADLDAIEAKGDSRRAKPAPDPKEEKQDEHEEEDAAPEPKPQTTPEPKKTPDPKAKEKPPEEERPVRAAELRTAYEKSKTTIKERDTEIARLKTELETVKSTPPDDPEKKTFKEKLTTAEKKLAEYEEELRFTNYRKHPEFTEKYEKPYHEAFAKALGEFEQITITDPEGNSRKATRADLDAMLRMSIDEVDRLATDTFGASAARAIRHVERLRDLADSYHGALAEAKAKGGEREKAKAAAAKEQQEKIEKLWTTENETAKTKYAKWFAPVEDDAEINEALRKGYALADKAFLSNGNIPPEQLVRIHAAVRNKAAGFNRLVLENKRAKARIAELEKSLKDFEDSEPAGGDGGKAEKTPGGNWLDDANSELDAIEKRKPR